MDIEEKRARVSGKLGGVAGVLAGVIQARAAPGKVCIYARYLEPVSATLILSYLEESCKEWKIHQSIG